MVPRHMRQQYVMHIPMPYRSVTVFISLKICPILSKDTYAVCFHYDLFFLSVNIPWIRRYKWPDPGTIRSCHKKYPILGQLYALLREYHRIIFSQKSDVLDAWIVQAKSLQIDERDTYVNGLLADIVAVKNAIRYKYNNGLAEGSVNKIKLTKRIMYGRNSFELLKAKLLLNEFYYEIN